MSEEIKSTPITENTEQSDTSTVEIIGINFREAGKIYYFAPAGLTPAFGDKVIVETARGVEIGTVKVKTKWFRPPR